MADYFWLICLVAVVFYLFVFFRLVYMIYREKTLYDLLSGQDDVRAEMANDPLRFHSTVIYLMTYMARFDDKRVELDKLRMIVQYIRKVCPSDIQKSAIDLLDQLTKGGRKVGKHREEIHVVDKVAFLSGDDDCVQDTVRGFTFNNRLHGTKLAEELVCRLSENDRLYVMYLFFRMAMLDGVITREGKRSEMNLLRKLCLVGLKVKSSAFDDLLQSCAMGTVGQWYSEHFDAEKYPDESQLANVFRSKYQSRTGFDPSRKTSYLDSILGYFIILTVVSMSVFPFYVGYVKDVMNLIYPVIVAVVSVASLVLPIVMVLFVKILDSGEFHILRTKYEDKLQRNGIILSTILSGMLLSTSYFQIFNGLYMLGNYLFPSDEPVLKEMSIEGSYSEIVSKRTYYYHTFQSVPFEEMDIHRAQKEDISARNKYCLDLLPTLYMVGGDQRRGFEDLHEVQVSKNDFVGHDSILLRFRVGYYGLLSYEGYSMVDRQQ